MEMATKVQDYSFKQFLKLRNSLNDWDNPFLQKLFQQLLQQDYEQFATDLEPYIKRLSTTWRNTTNEIARPENAPTIRHYNAYNERIDRIVRPLDKNSINRRNFQ